MHLSKFVSSYAIGLIIVAAGVFTAHPVAPGQPAMPCLVTLQALRNISCDPL